MARRKSTNRSANANSEHAFPLLRCGAPRLRVRPGRAPYRGLFPSPPLFDRMPTYRTQGKRSLNFLSAQKNKDTVQKVIESYFGQGVDWMDHVDLGYTRAGQDVRYALDDSKLRSLGWEPKRIFDKEIYDIVDYYKNNFIW